ncbi:L,D-transpeptidase family protein [Hyphobacterium sp. CCMP332]|uniref:L,D-transpeptidase family protein n=1 Tax=Hyphobacterium sp. CCMP332 TaxID=2749086 RepID=UPI00164FB47D|nr:L,D-transpeptidase family protein [Hyphobacterium sp. CCMP332]QNL20044.1 L,D-transpeptidase family protein [Hyphobacterium sp. CCMP332]
MTRFTVTSDGVFQSPTGTVRAALGKGGVKPEADKVEGDGATPLGVYTLRRVLYRKDRGDAPTTALPVRAIHSDDGWCDAPDDPAYNRPVRLPYPASCEEMARRDELYDIVVVLSHNDDPPVPGKGSAVFLHCAKPGYPPTLGCVALARDDLEHVLANARPGDTLEIRR